MAYGLPGKPDYSYERPFDYFNFETERRHAPTWSKLLFSRGLLYGTDYALGADYRGIWGLYGTYEYVAPQVFRVSTTAAALGTHRPVVAVSRRVALQGTALVRPGLRRGRA